LYPLDRFQAQLPSIDASVPLAVHCKSGYRSMAACSMLLGAGYTNVTNVVGGFDGWEAARFPVIRE
jgi:adenylyltransferase/sulfurtransferase